MWPCLLSAACGDWSETRTGDSSPTPGDASPAARERERSEALGRVQVRRGRADTDGRGGAALGRLLLEQVVELGASDLHITAGAPPIVRVHGDLVPLEGLPRADADTTRVLLYRILSTEKQKHLEIDRQIDFSYGVPGLARFRVNVYLQRDTLAAAFRVDPGRAEDARGARTAAEPERARAAAARPRARHRADRLG